MMSEQQKLKKLKIRTGIFFVAVFVIAIGCAHLIQRSQENREKIEKECREFERYLWNTSSNPRKHTEHLSMTLKVEPGEDYILQRLKREGRHGRITKIGETRLRYDIDVYDASEMRPWVRSFMRANRRHYLQQRGFRENFSRGSGHDVQTVYRGRP